MPKSDPEAKRGTERLHDYLERSFLPGRTFDSPTDFNSQLQAWLQWPIAAANDPWVAPQDGSPRIWRRC
jgi:hypothetical protein